MTFAFLWFIWLLVVLLVCFPGAFLFFVTGPAHRVEVRLESILTAVLIIAPAVISAVCYPSFLFGVPMTVYSTFSLMCLVYFATDNREHMHLGYIPLAGDELNFFVFSHHIVFLFICYAVWNSTLPLVARLAIPIHAMVMPLWLVKVALLEFSPPPGPSWLRRWMWALRIRGDTGYQHRITAVEWIWMMYALFQSLVFILFLLAYHNTMWYNLAFGLFVALYYLVYRRDPFESVISGLFRTDKMSIIFLYGVMYVYKNWDSFQKHTLINLMFLGFIFVFNTGKLDKYRYTHLVFVVVYTGVVLLNRSNFVNHFDDPYYVVACIYSITVFEICDQLVKVNINTLRDMPGQVNLFCVLTFWCELQLLMLSM
jgi:hypothetical protein